MAAFFGMNKCKQKIRNWSKKKNENSWPGFLKTPNPKQVIFNTEIIVLKDNQL